MPVKKRYDNQLTTPVSSQLKEELQTIKEELGIQDLTDLTRRVLQSFVDAYFKRPRSQSTGPRVPAMAHQAVMAASRGVVASTRNLESVIGRLAGRVEVDPEELRNSPFPFPDKDDEEEIFFPAEPESPKVDPQAGGEGGEA